jgi:FeS assembly SUF system protein
MRTDEHKTPGEGEPTAGGAQSVGSSRTGGDPVVDLWDEAKRSEIEEHVVEAIREVYDPEIPVNVYDLGLIYGIQVNPDHTVNITMTLTTPNCPAAGFLPGQVEARARHIPDVQDARVEITFDPPFTPEMMSDEAKLELGFM